MLKSYLRAGTLALAVGLLAGCVTAGGGGRISPFGNGTQAPAFSPVHPGFRATNVMGAPSPHYQSFSAQEQSAFLTALRDGLNSGQIGQVISLGDANRKGFVIKVLGTSPGSGTFDDLLGGRNFQGQRSTMKGCLVLHHYVFADGWRRVGGYAHACPTPEYDAWAVYPAREFAVQPDYWNQVLSR